MLREPTEGSQKQDFIRFTPAVLLAVGFHEVHKKRQIFRKKNQNQNLDVTGEVWQTVHDGDGTRMVLLLICPWDLGPGTWVSQEGSGGEIQPNSLCTFLTSATLFFLLLLPSWSVSQSIFVSQQQSIMGRWGIMEMAVNERFARRLTKWTL